VRVVKFEVVKNIYCVTFLAIYLSIAWHPIFGLSVVK